MKLRLKEFCFCLIAGVALFIPIKGNLAMADGLGCKTEVWINESIERVSGKRWPRASDGTPLSMRAIEEVCEIVLHLPTKGSWAIASKQTIMQQQRNFVTVVAVLPFAGTLNFASALAAADNFVAAHQIRDIRFLERLANWRTAPPNKSPFGSGYRAITQIDKGVDLVLELKYQASRDAWFLSIELDGESPTAPPR